MKCSRGGAGGSVVAHRDSGPRRGPGTGVKNLRRGAQQAVAACRRPGDDRCVSGAQLPLVLAPVLGVVSGCAAEALVRRTRPARSAGRGVLLVAAAVLVVGAAAWRTPGDGAWWRVAVLALAVAAVPLSAVDLAEQRIPDLVLYPAFSFAALLLGADAAANHSDGAFVRALLAAAALYAGALALLLAARDSLGYGDVKAFAYQGLYTGYLGWGRVLAALLLALTAAAAVALVLIVSRAADQSRRLAFAPYLLGATLTAVLLQ